MKPKKKNKKINTINGKVNEKDNKKCNKISFMKDKKRDRDIFGEIFTGYSKKLKNIV